MQEYTTNGTIITEPLSAASIEAGTVCLVQKDNQYHRVTIQYITTEGDWFVEGDYNGEINRMKTLYKLSVLTDRDSFPIVLKDWKKVITQKLLGEKVNILLRPHRFKEGKYAMVCTDCSSHFMGSKSQPFCKKCCEEMSTASLVFPKKKRKCIVNYTENQVLKIIEWLQTVPTNLELFQSEPEELLTRYKKEQDGGNSNSKA